MKTLSFLIIIYSLFLISCESVVKDFEIKDPEDKITIVGYAVADSFPAFYITKNIGLNDPIEFPPLTAASAELYKNNEVIGSLAINDSNWFSLDTYSYEPGNNYSLRVSAPGINTVTADFLIPTRPEMIVVDTNLELVKNIGCEFCSQSYDFEYEIKFMNQPGIDEYYSVELKQIQNCPGYDYYYCSGKSTKSIYSNAPYIETVRDYGDSYNNRNATEDASGFSFYFSDRLLDNGENNLTISTSINPYDFDTASTVQFVLIFKKIDKNMYEYVRSMGRNYNAEDNPFVQPVSIYTNVGNGLGLVSGFSQVEYTVVMDEVIKNMRSDYY